MTWHDIHIHIYINTYMDICIIMHINAYMKYINEYGIEDWKFNRTGKTNKQIRTWKKTLKISWIISIKKIKINSIVMEMDLEEKLIKSHLPVLGQNQPTKFSSICFICQEVQSGILQLLPIDQCLVKCWPLFSIKPFFIWFIFFYLFVNNSRITMKKKNSNFIFYYRQRVVSMRKF